MLDTGARLHNPPFEDAAMNVRRSTLCLSAAVLISAVLAPTAFAEESPAVTIVTAAGASPLETLASRELRRYVYLRTGRLPTVSVPGALPGGDVVVVRKDHLPAGAAEEIRAAAQSLAPQQYILKTLAAGPRKTLWIVGGDDPGVLYGVYRVAERLGVRFYLHGDTVPDVRIAW
jgi:alpha-glucuronidase